MGQVLPAERWLQLRPLLDRALDLELPERIGMLADLQAQSPQLHADLERLLRHHASAEGELDRPAARLIGETMPMEGVQAQDQSQGGAYSGAVVGAFQLDALIGSGGMGAVYRARRISGGFEQTVAIKLITGLHPGLKKRFTRERQILADLRHPHIAQLLDGGETSIGLPYLVMEYIDGHNLVDHCERSAATLDERLRLLIDVAEALQHAHQRKLIHRDIKPGNIMVSHDGEVKLLDFGIAKLLDDADRSALTQQGLGPMTPAYAAPEQFSGGNLGPATDLYQWGVLAFRLLTGRSPYRHDSGNPLMLARLVSDSAPLSLQSVLKPVAPRIVADPDPDTGLPDTDSLGLPEPMRLPTPPPDLLSYGRICADLDLILRRCLQKQPGQRYPDMQALIADLQAVRQRHAPSVRRGLRRRRWLAAAAAIVVLVLSVVLWRWSPWSSGNADAWQHDPALNAMGLDRSHLHLGHARTETLIVQALRREAQGDTASARALLETALDNDSATPVPAMLLTYWAQTPEDAQRWRSQAAQRLDKAHDATLDLLWRFIEADLEGSVDEVLRYSGALLELDPQAWYLHMARAHRLNQRGLRAAGLKELQQIDPTGLGHRKLSDAIADRASFGDLPGAQALTARLEVSPDDPDYAQLLARLAFTSGDLAAAAGHFRDTVRLARLQARFDLEGRGLLYQGVMEGSLGDYAAATESVRAARAVFDDHGQWALSIDASLVLAQLAQLLGNAADVALELDQARAVLRSRDTDAADERIELVAARLQGKAPTLPAQTSADLVALINARRAMLAGDANAARVALERARRERIEQSPLVEEYRLLQRELGMQTGPLPALDPPFQPYIRFAARWAMGEGGSVAPRSALR